MRLQHIIEQVNFRPWFISAEGHASIARILAAKLADERIKADAAFGGLFSQRPALSFDADQIAHVHAFGVLGQGLSGIEKMCGNTDYADIIADLAAAQQGGARGIVLHVDSPGGMCCGCIEAARAVASTGLPTAAVTSGTMASAAYCLAVGCDTIFASASSMVGCIGTIMPWVDESKKWEDKGKSFQPITNTGADLKSTMHGPSITPEQLEYLQGLADDYADQFISHVQAFRTPDGEVYRGGAYTGARSLGYGLVDEIGDDNDATASVLAVL